MSLPEAFGGNRRLYTLAAPAADPFVGPRVYPRPKRVDRFLTDFYVIYILSTSMIAHDVENIVFLQCFVAFGGHDLRLTGHWWCRLCVPRGRA